MISLCSDGSTFVIDSSAQTPDREPPEALCLAGSKHPGMPEFNEKSVTAESADPHEWRPFGRPSGGSDRIVVVPARSPVRAGISGGVQPSHTHD